MDMLVHLLKLPPLVSIDGLIIRRAQPFEMSRVRGFIERNFHLSWADEVSVGFANKPVSVFIATRDGDIVGFAAYECTRRAFFGPMGVLESERGRGAGKALLIACMHGLAEMGYVYGIIGGVGPVEFYEKTVGAIPIAHSTPGIYTDKLRKH
jgi:predicted N-acetyltransferase YhbS